MNKFSWSKIKKPVFVLAPMAEITTLPFRSLCKELGADIVFTPMISADAIIHNEIDTLKIVEFLPKEQPVIVQIFGYDGDLIAKAVGVVDARLKPAGIDINMGCPAPKITGNECGSALLRDYDKAIDIVKKVRKSYKGQLSVKLRLGWNSFDLLEFAKELEKIGVDAISVHGRTAKQGYRGEADWTAIQDIAESVKVPVIGNGDIKTWNDAIKKAGIPNLAGVMIGRRSLERPWIFKEIREKQTIDYTNREISELLERLTDSYVKFVGDETKATRELKKYYAALIKGFSGAQELRIAAMKSSTLAELKRVTERLRTC